VPLGHHHLFRRLEKSVSAILTRTRSGRVQITTHALKRRPSRLARGHSKKVASSTSNRWNKPYPLPFRRFRAGRVACVIAFCRAYNLTLRPIRPVLGRDTRLWIFSHFQKSNRDFRQWHMAWQDHIAPFPPGKWEKDETIPKKPLPKIAELGFGRVTCPRTSAAPYGPAGRDAGVRGAQPWPCRRSRRSYRSTNMLRQKCWTALPVI